MDEKNSAGKLWLYIMKSSFKPMLLVLWKDILTEIRNKDIILASFVFAVLVLVICNFAFDITPATVHILASGILWISFTFAGILVMTRSFVVENELDSLEGLLLCPISRDSLYWGKMLSLFLFMMVVELLLLPIFAVLFDYNVLSLSLILIMVLATIGFATVGTLFASMSVNTRAREIMLPILFFPIVTPVLIAAVEASMSIIGGGTSVINIREWIEILIIFDVVYLVVCPWAFGFVVEE